MSKEDNVLRVNVLYMLYIQPLQNMRYLVMLAELDSSYLDWISSRHYALHTTLLLQHNKNISVPDSKLIFVPIMCNILRYIKISSIGGRQYSLGFKCKKVIYVSPICLPLPNS